VHEIDVLADSLHRAAVAASDARRSLQQAYLEILEALVESLEARDQYTAGHSRRVSLYSVWIGQQMGLSPAELERLRIGALLHDIGKIGIPDAVLLKDGRLTDEEFATIKKHPEIGVRILERIGAFGEYLGAVGLHHENHDGSGYPKGLRGEAIPVDARIVHVADAYDAMTSNRPYRQRMPEEKVRRILRECSGTQFDPAAVAAFFASPIDSTAANLEKLYEAIHDPAVRVPLADAGQPLAG
jgi:putative nucleotidyltransferase with HDIG domain